MKHLAFCLLSVLFLTSTLTSCNQQNNPSSPDEGIALSCSAPSYLKSGDKVALISPSYSTSMENVEKTADVLRGWGLEPVIGKNVGEVYENKYAGTVEQRVSDKIGRAHV